MMYDTYQLPRLPQVIELMRTRNHSMQVGFEAGFARLFDAAEGMSSSVDCRDLFHDVSIDDVTEVVDTNANYGFLYNTGFYGTACEEWNVGEVDPSFNELVTSDIPALCSPAD